MARIRQLSLVVAVVALVAVTARDAAGQYTGARDALLDVPYLTQTELLCGGAALAMVMRYWGDTDVFAQDFSSLVDRTANGIRAEALLGAARSRGWRASVLAPTTEGVSAMRDAIRSGVPIIALIEDRPNVLHYVVVVGATGDSVILHDPARSPFRVVKLDEFERRSTAGDRWMAIVRPAGDGGVRVGTPRPGDRISALWPDGPNAPCNGLVDRGVALAEQDDLMGAENQLLAATSLCAGSAAPWRELAGLRFRQERYAEARAFAERATQLAPNDAHAWQLLATSRFMTDDTLGALAAWEQHAPLRVGVVRVVGAERLDHPAIVEATGLEPRQALTSDHFWRARRRLAELPALVSAALTVEPGADGVAGIRAVVDEAPTFPTDVKTLGTIGVRTIFTKEIAAHVSNAFKQGEVIGAAYRWSPHRRRLRGEFAIPAPGFLPGVATLDVEWEEFTFNSSLVAFRDEALGDFIQRRRRAGLHLADWTTGWLHWTAGGGIDRFETTTHASFDGAIDVRAFGDRAALGIAAGLWTPVGGDDGGAAPSFAGTTVMGAWRSTTRAMTPSLMAWAGISVMSADAPLAIWQGAGTSDNRPALLRAHRLHTGGVINSQALGRSLAFGTVEYVHPVYARPMASISVAGFTDVASAWRRDDPGAASPWIVDIGAGLRIHTGSAGTIRLDVAYSPRDKRRALSAGFTTEWPRLFSGAWSRS